jgi:hypothetical protein
MSITWRYAPPLLISAGAAASIAVAPIAAADSGVLPQPGSENASHTINDLTAQGYDVQINWVNGIPRVDLSQCWVNGINTAAAGAAGLQTAYVDIECPK